MSAITTGLNNTESTNRIRFEKVSQRLQKVNVDILHTVHDDSIVSEVNNHGPDTGNLGCYFQDELDQLKKLDATPHFKKFNFDINPFVQSLPELMHHQSKVVTMLANQITTVPAGEVQSYLSLIVVLARYLLHCYVI
jgi:U3 small nucleolar RNA-associated protein 20